MCGINGLYSPHQEDLSKRIKNMNSCLVHRGPDAEGEWNNNEGLGFGHRRLAIIDITEHAKQPMHSISERYTITYNGEIYNFQQLRQQTTDYRYRTESDTEVILACLEKWGVEETLAKITGMFALGIWDRSRKTLYLARDRMGEKPIYYGKVGEEFVFSSELKPIIAESKANLSLNKQACADLFKYNYIPAPLSIFNEVKKLPPASFLKTEDFNNFEVKKYWTPAIKTLDLSFEEATGVIESHLRNVIKNQMISDVPLGAFLSGGVDSSAIVALMAAVSGSNRVKTFTIGFNDPTYNEAPFAAAVAKHLGTTHEELELDPNRALDHISDLPQFYDEPFSDSSQLPTYLVAQLTKKHVTVALSGDGGDEVFGGYNRYIQAPNLFKKFRSIPGPLKQLLGKGIKSLSAEQWQSLAFLSPKKVSQFGVKMHKLAGVLDSKTEFDLYDRLLTHWEIENTTTYDEKYANSSGSFAQKMMSTDLQTYLPDDIMVKVDRATMANSLESRSPFLDHKLIELSHSLPLVYHIENGVGKKLLRNILFKYVPKELIDRPKQGFSIPLARWLREDLRDWAGDLISQSNDDLPIPKKLLVETWEQHLANKAENEYLIWDALILIQWKNKFGF